MGLLERFLNNGSALDIETPSVGGGPISDPISGFVQNYLPNSNYEDATLGQPDNGSELANTLNQTALDTSDSSYTGNTLPPPTNTPYPNQARGEFGGAPSQFEQNYNSNVGNRYLDYINSIGSSQPQTLSQTNLDTNEEGTSNIPNPLNTGTPLSPPHPLPSGINMGEFGGAPSQFEQNWNVDNQYISNFNPNTQPDTLSQTALDNTDNTNDGTTQFPPPLPGQSDTITTYPPLTQGPFADGSNPFIQNYGPNNTYLDNEFNLDNIDTNPQVQTLSQTNLDIDGNGTSNIPNPLSALPDLTPNYPLSPNIRMGEFGGAPSQFEQNYNSNVGNRYLDPKNINPIINSDTNPQVQTLSQTALDNTVPQFLPTTPPPLPDNTSYPNQTHGEFGGASSQFSQTWGPNNQYINNFNPNTQPDTLSQTGLDQTDNSNVPTTTDPLDLLLNVPLPTYNSLSPNINMGVFGGGPRQFSQNYNSNVGNRYLDTNNFEDVTNDNTNPQVQTLNNTNLDNTDKEGTSNIPNPLLLPATKPYPGPSNGIPQKVYMGKFYGQPFPFKQPYAPNNQYLDPNNINSTVNPTTNPQVTTLDKTGLDVENPTEAYEIDTANNFAPILPDNTPYPYYVGTGDSIGKGTNNSNFTQYHYNQKWTPRNEYWKYFLKNRSKFNTGPLGASSAYPYETNPRLKGNFAFGSNVIDAISDIKNVIRN